MRNKIDSDFKWQPSMCLYWKKVAVGSYEVTPDSTVIDIKMLFLGTSSILVIHSSRNGKRIFVLKENQKPSGDFGTSTTETLSKQQGCVHVYCTTTVL